MALTSSRGSSWCCLASEPWKLLENILYLAFQLSFLVCLDHVDGSPDTRSLGRGGEGRGEEGNNISNACDVVSSGTSMCVSAAALNPNLETSVSKYLQPSQWQRQQPRW